MVPLFSGGDLDHQSVFCWDSQLFSCVDGGTNWRSMPAALLNMALPLHRAWKPLGIPLFFCTLNAGGRCSAWFELSRGKRYVTWQTVRARADED